MTHQLTIEVSEEVFKPLLDKATASGRSPEAVASDLVAQGVFPQPGELLRRWAGAINSGIPDVAERHDEYLGQNLYDELKG
jgi:hypothetical protein